MTEITSRLAALAAGTVAIALAVLSAWLYIELRKLRSKHATTVQQLATKTEDNAAY
jgi:hypothetical protein